MREIASFFSDSKTIIALIALVLTVVNMILSFRNQKTQNKKWELLNDADVVVKDVIIEVRKKLPMEDAKKIAWGYDPLVHTDKENLDFCTISYYLAVLDETGNELDKINPVLTLQDLQNELQRIGYPTTSPVTVLKMFNARFTIENIGKTTAQESTIVVEMQYSNRGWKMLSSSERSKISLSPGLPSTYYAHFFFDIRLEIPKEVFFQVTLNYKSVEGKIVSKLVPLSWSSSKNAWFRK